MTYICQLLKPYLKRKHLEIVFEGQRGLKINIPLTISSTECLDLASIQVDTDITKTMVQYPSSRSDTLRDTYREGHGVLKNVLQALPILRGQRFVSVYGNLVREFTAAAMRRDVECFDVKLSEILGHSTQWCNQWLEMETAASFGTSMSNIPDDYSFTRLHELEESSCEAFEDDSEDELDSDNETGKSVQSEEDAMEDEDVVESEDDIDGDAD